MVYRIAPCFIPRRVSPVFDCGRTVVSDVIALSQSLSLMLQVR
jgi:hypothetical protein